MVKFHSICDDNNVILCKFIFVQPQKIYEQSFRFQFDHLLRAAFRHFKYINTLLLYSTLSHFPKHNTFSLCATTFYYYYLAENLRMRFSVLQWKWFSCLRFWICSKWRFKAMTHAFGSFVCLKNVEIFKILPISNIFFSKHFSLNFFKMQSNKKITSQRYVLHHRSNSICWQMLADLFQLQAHQFGVKAIYVYTNCIQIHLNNNHFDKNGTHFWGENLCNSHRFVCAKCWAKSEREREKNLHSNNNSTESIRATHVSNKHTQLLHIQQW